jgi:type 1 fimbriae regulatory protein FimB
MPTTPPPKRRKNTDVRPHEFLTPDEVQRMLDAVKKSSGRNKERDTLIITMLFLHGLRVSELVRLQWS